MKDLHVNPWLLKCSRMNGSDAPDLSPAESDKVSDLQSYHFDQTNNDTPEEDDNPISRVTHANLEPGKEWEPERTQKIGLLLAELTDDPRLRDKKVRKRESDDLRTKNNNHRILVNLINLDLLINSFIVLLESPTVDPNLAFFTMAWLAVYQIKELESMTHGVFSDMENKGLSDRKRSSSVQASIGLSKIAEAVNPQYASGHKVGITKSGGEGALAT